MKFLIFLGALLFSVSGFTKGVTVSFNCGQNTSVNISYDEKGNLVVSPNIFESEIEDKECLRKFKETVWKEVNSFKQKNCPASKDELCFVSVHFTQRKLLEKIRQSDIPSTSTIPSHSTTSSVETNDNVVPSTAEAELESKILSREIDPKNLNQTFTHDGKEYKVSDFDNVIGENIENAFMNMSRDEALQYAQNYMLEKADILKDTNAPGRVQVMQNLEKMFGYIHGENGQKELQIALNECRSESETFDSIEDIIAKIEDTRKVLQCEPLTPGSHKVFKRDMSNYYSTGNYLLKRRQDGNYQAILNIQFKRGTGSLPPEEMLARSKRCLAEASPYMKGPNGEQLEIVVMSPSETETLPSDERPAKYEVSIEGPDFGTHSVAYNETVGCPTITHEILHLLGLCDEYKEDRPEYAKYGWTCRVVTKAPSIMRDLSAYRNVVGATVSCDCSGATCSAIMNGNDQMVKKLYTSSPYYDLSDHRFRTSYCKEEFINSKQLSNPSKVSHVLSNQNNVLTFETRTLYTQLTSPYYKISHIRVTCRCPAGNEECNRQRQQLANTLTTDSPRKTCPSGASYKGSEPGKKFLGGTLEGTILKIGSSGEVPSLLQPNHFYKILEGNCQGKANGYRECAEFAYKNEPCNVPARCNDDKYYLGSEQ